MNLHPDVELRELENHSFLLHHKTKNEYYKLGREEGLFLKVCSGDIERAAGPDWDDATVLQARQFFQEAGILWDGETPLEKGKRKLDIIKIKLCAFSADGLLDRWKRAIAALTGDTAIACYKGILLAGVFLSIVYYPVLAAHFRPLFQLDHYLSAAAGLDLCIAYALTILAMGVHELAHVLLCYRHCGETGKVGVMLYFLQPALYSDLTCLNGIADKRGRLQTLWAGVFAQWVLGALALGLYLVLQSVGRDAGFLPLFIVINGGISLFNLVPFIKLDGYWILSAHLETQFLYETAVAHLIRRVLRVPGAESAVRPQLLTAYGLGAAAVFSLLWGAVLYGIYSVALLFIGQGGATLAAAAVALLLIIQLCFALRGAYSQSIQNCEIEV